jgi:beta-galactosidase
VVKLFWELREEGRLIAKGEITLPGIPPQESRKIELPEAAWKSKPEKETWLNLSYRTVSSSPFWEMGYELGWNQFQVGGQWTMPVPSKRQNTIELNQDDSRIMVEADDWSIIFDKTTGTLISWEKNNTPLIQRGPRPDFWRAPTDNDRGAGLHNANKQKILYPSNQWEKAGGAWKPEVITAEITPAGKAKIAFVGSLMENAVSLSIQYEVDGAGGVIVDYRYATEQALPVIPRVGTEWILEPRFDQLEWYGPGPLPTYSDRNFERVGHYTTTVMENWVDYSKPQENGNKVNVRWLTLKDEQGYGLQFSGTQPLSCNVLPYSKNKIEDTAYSWQLGKPQSIYLNIDYAQMGVGGDNSWGLTCHPQYRLSEKAYYYQYRVNPVGF